MSHSVKLLCLVPVILGLSVSSLANESQANKSEANIERFEIFHSRHLNSVNNSLTQDNVLLFTELTTNGGNSIGNALSQAAGVELNGQGGLFQSYNIRGFSRSRIKTEVDGVPIITDRRAGNSVSFLPPALVNQVYLQKGPISSLYGSGAMGGVVSLSTQVDNSGLGISWSAQNSATQYLVKHNSSLLNGSMLYRKANNASAFDGTMLNSQYRQSVGNLHFDADWQGLRIRASTMLSRGSDIGKSSSTFPEQGTSIYPKDNHWLSQVTLTDDQSWKVQLYQHRQNWQSDTTKLQQGSFATRSLTDYRAVTLGSLATFAFDDTTLGFEWIGRRGVDISEQGLDQAGQSLFSKEVVDGEEDNFSLFVSHQIFWQDLTLNLGLRQDWIQAENDNLVDSQYSKKDEFTSVSIGGNYALSHHTNLHFELARAFRFPSISELFFSGETPRGNTQGNPLLEPETSVGWQLSVKHKLTPKTQLQLNTYQYAIADYIERYRADNGVRLFRNTQDVKIQGAELVVDWHLAQTLDSSLSFQIQRGRDQDNQPIDDIQPKAIKWSLSWSPSSLQSHKLTLLSNLKYQFRKTQTGDSEQPLDSQTLWNAAVRVALNEDMDIHFSVNNITNSEYLTSADEDAPLQADRHWQVEWTWRY